MLYIGWDEELRMLRNLVSQCDPAESDPELRSAVQRAQERIVHLETLVAGREKFERYRVVLVAEATLPGGRKSELAEVVTTSRELVRALILAEEGRVPWARMVAAVKTTVREAAVDLKVDASISSPGTKVVGAPRGEVFQSAGTVRGKCSKCGRDGRWRVTPGILQPPGESPGPELVCGPCQGKGVE